MEEMGNTSASIITAFTSDEWEKVGDVDRSFARHINTDPSPGKMWRYSGHASDVVLSIAIPTLDGHRDGHLPALLWQIGEQTFKNFEIVLVKGDPRQGRAINIAAAKARGKFLLTLDDDTSLTDHATFQKMIDVMQNKPDIGMAGGSNQIPADTNAFVRRVMSQIPRRATAPVSTITDSDLAEHNCLIMRTDEFKKVGGENELLKRGLDPYLREEYRKNNMRVVVIPEVIYHHLPPPTLATLVRQFFRNGRHAAHANRHYPQWIIETPTRHGNFRKRVPLAARICRFPLRLAGALFTGKPLWFLSELAYGLGFIHEWLKFPASCRSTRTD